MQGSIETRVGIFVLLALGVFVYMGFHIGAFRFDTDNYNTYEMSFKDISGLSRKADVKIAGVKVGWVKDVSLLTTGDVEAKATVMIDKDYALYSDAYAVVRQDGLLGPKYIELIPGDPLMQRLTTGSMLSKPSVAPVAVDEILKQFKDIAGNIQEVTESFKDVLGGFEGKEYIKSIFDSIHTTAEHMSSFSTSLDRSISRNEDNIDSFLEIGNHVRRLSEQLENEVFPSLQNGLNTISQVFERDLDRVAGQISSTATALEEASIQARDGLRSIGSIADKIDEGKGLLGKIINEDKTYYDLRDAIQGVKNYVTKIDRMQIIFDSHFESMHRQAENYLFEDAKGYFNMRIHPSQDYFYVLQLATSEKGFVERHERHRLYMTENNSNERPFNTNPVVEANTLDLPDWAKLGLVYRRRDENYKRNTVKVGLQFGKAFDRIAVRFGLFEGSAGVGVDCDIPLISDRLRWVTTLEVFDTTGWNRKDNGIIRDHRAHLKWLNKMFFMRNLYFTFGADDFISKRNATAFIGGGVRFGDDDVKYLLSSLSGASGAAGYIH